MNHEQIIQSNVIDRYLMGQLPAAERVAFEEHFVGCPDCVAQLQLTETFRQDLRRFAVEQTVSIGLPVSKPPPWWRLPRHWRQPLSVAAGCLLILTVVGFFAAQYARRLQAEIRIAASRAEQLERLYEVERQATMAAERRQQENARQYAEQLQALEARRQAAEATRAKAAAASNRRQLPEGNLQIFSLQAERGSEPQPAASGNTLALASPSARFVLSILLAGEQPFSTYRMTIFDDRQQRVWRSAPRKPDHNAALSEKFSANQFRPGTYLLMVEGRRQGASWSDVGAYRFVLVKTR